MGILYGFLGTRGPPIPSLHSSLMAPGGRRQGYPRLRLAVEEVVTLSLEQEGVTNVTQIMEVETEEVIIKRENYKRERRKEK